MNQEIDLKNTTLPPDHPPNIIGSPTMNRLEDFVPRMLGSAQKLIKQDNLDQDSWFIVNDASNTPNASELRASSVQGLDELGTFARTFFMTPELQKRVANEIQDRLHGVATSDGKEITSEMVEAVLLWTGYASQRAKLDVVIGGLALQGKGDIRVISLDDDILVPQKKVKVKRDALTNRHRHMPNSQILMPSHDFNRNGNPLEDIGPNSFKDYFKYLGKTVGQIKKDDQDFRVTEDWLDTMHITLEHAMDPDNGVQAYQFVVTHADEEDMSRMEEAVVIGVNPTKFFMPDYRTIRIAQAFLLAEFPEKEVPMLAYPSGDNKPFAYRQCRTNVDSAVLGRVMNEETAMWPWWFVSNDAISRKNPLQTVKGHYRADNELLPVLLEVIAAETGRKFVYMSGIETQLEHHRAPSGYRPNMHEQAAASLVGNIAALQAAERLEFNPDTGIARMRRVGENYQAPWDHAQQVFYELERLAMTCQDQSETLEDRKRQIEGKLTNLLKNKDSFSEDEFNRKYDKINDQTSKTLINQDRYRQTYSDLEKMLGNFNFKTFYEHLCVEVRDQLNFYADVLDVMPLVIQEASDLIKTNQYPVLEAVRSDGPTKNYPQSKRKG